MVYMSEKTKTTNACPNCGQTPPVGAVAHICQNQSVKTEERTYYDSPKPLPDFWEAYYIANTRRAESNLARAYIDLYNWVDRISKRRHPIAFEADFLHAKR